jgi:hypothetical protein
LRKKTIYIFRKPSLLPGLVDVTKVVSNNKSHAVTVFNNFPSPFTDSNDLKTMHNKNSLSSVHSHFITKNSTRVISQRGGLAILPCSVTMTQPATVSRVFMLFYTLPPPRNFPLKAISWRRWQLRGGKFFLTIAEKMKILCRRRLNEIRDKNMTSNCAVKEREKKCEKLKSINSIVCEFKCRHWKKIRSRLKLSKRKRFLL